MVELQKLQDKLTKQLEFATKKLATAEHEPEEEAWHGYVQALKYVLCEILIVKNEEVV